MSIVIYRNHGDEEIFSDSAVRDPEMCEDNDNH